LKQGRSLDCGLEGGALGGRLKMRGKWLERGRSGVWPAEGRSEFALGRLQQERKCKGWSKRGMASVCRGGFLFQGRERRSLKEMGFRVRVFFLYFF
jgi:hypothetical protein